LTDRGLVAAMFQIRMFCAAVAAQDHRAEGAQSAVAREQQRTAYDMFGSVGAEAFAERARIELLATGERARRRTAETRDELTAQEAQIARLVSKGGQQPGYRRAAVPEPLHRRLPPAEGVPEDRRGIADAARARHGR
jgi:hypothetical protein